MRAVSGLTIVLADPSARRLRTALTMALAAQALGGRARIFLDAEAVPLLATPLAEGDAAFAAAGLPSTALMLDEALVAGVRIILCQTGLALAGLTADALDPRFDYGGMVGIVADLGDDRLVIG